MKQTHSQSKARTARRHYNSSQHMKRFDGGRRTPNEYHREHAFPPSAECAGCGGPPAVRAIVLAELKEAIKHRMVPASLDGRITAAVARTLVDLRGPSGPVKHARISATYSCDNCRKTMEVALAKAPSWCIVEINEGPNPRNRVQVGYTN